MKYKSKTDLQDGVSEKKLGVGTVVYSQTGEAGKIVTISHDICTIEFSTGKKVPAKYPDVFKTGMFTTKPRKE